MKEKKLLLVLIIATLIFFWKFFLRGLLPIPADTIVGMYHPWRDFFADQYPNGIPFKNFLITDPVRQQYPWRKLAIELLKKGQWPLWNPYTFAGTPLLANFQSAPFYPLNILFFFLPFNFTWSILIILQPLLASLFLFLYLRHFNLHSEACFLGAMSFAFSGFFIAWLEWNTILHVALWLPLILLSIEKTLDWFNNSKRPKSKNQKGIILWSVILIFSLVSSFFAGHLQVFFYVFLTSLIYAMVRILSLDKKEKGKAILLLVTCYLLLVAITSIQWLPTLKFISLSAREFDQANWQKEGWFIPWQHLIQFLAPDFFGNPTTLNYWGTWNYAEMVGYIGVFPLIMALFAMIWRRDKKTLFFGTTFFLSLIFALPTPLAKLPYQLKIPFLSTSQPTRLLFLTDFSLAILAALGFDWLLKTATSIIQIIKVIVGLLVLYAALWTFVLIGNRWLTSEQWINNLAIAKRNLILPTGLFIISAILLFISSLRERASAHSRSVFTILVACCLLLVACGDLLRFGWKFTPFTKKEYLFPSTKVIEFLRKQKEPFRIMTTDKRIFPPNFSIIYKLQTVDGYDPLYLRDYGELVAAWVRGKPDISPFSFNRILAPQNYESRLADLLNVKYVLSLDKLSSEKLVKVFEEGKIKVYENKNVFPRAFLVYDYKVAKKREAIKLLMNKSVDFKKTAILEEELKTPPRWPNGLLGGGGKSETSIVKYSPNQIIINVETDKSGILILGDNFYPGWQAMIDEAKESVKTFRVDYTFRGIIVPEGTHKINFYPSL